MRARVNPLRKRVLSVSAFAIAAFVSAALVLARAASAEDASPNAASPDSDWELESQVLEIPQACTDDGGVLSCDAPGAGISPADPSEDGAATAGSARDDATAGDSTLDDAVVNDEFGTLEDYESQGDTMGPVVSTARVIGPVWGPPLGPVGYTPGARLGPIVPSIPTSPFGSGPWMVPPSATFRHPTSAPMMAPRSSFRIH